jgi:flagellar hook assembly protein FlgD
LVREFTGFAEPGTISINWNGKTENGEAVSSGMYFYRMSTSSFAQTKKMVLVK